MAGNRAVIGSDLRRQYDSYVKTKKGPGLFYRHLKESLEKKQLQPSDFSIRELFEAFVPNGMELANSWGGLGRQKGGHRTRELLEAGSGQAVGYADFSNITGQIFFTEVLEKYSNAEFIFSAAIEHRMSVIQDIEKIPGIARLGSTPAAVGEGTAYGRYGTSEDYIEAPAKTKRGGIVEVTKEAIAGDLTGVLLERCGELGFDLGYGVEERVINAIIDENTNTSAYTGGTQYTWKGTAYGTYQGTTPWVNLATSNPLIVDETCVETIWKLLVAITDPYTGRPILQMPKVLICTPDLAFKAARLMHTMEHRTYPTGLSTSGSSVEQVGPPALPKVVGMLEILTSPILKKQMNLATNWFVGDPRRCFRRYYNWDITPAQRGTGTDAEFERDIVQQFKCSLKDCVTTVNPRYMGKSSA